MKPSIGRIVHFVQKKPYGDGLLHLPAMIVAVWGDTCVNLQVITDGSSSEGDYGQQSIRWVTSSTQDETAQQPRSWHWPERE